MFLSILSYIFQVFETAILLDDDYQMDVEVFKFDIRFFENDLLGYATFAPVSILSIVVIALWCASSWKELSTKVIKWTLCLVYLSLVFLYFDTSVFAFPFAGGVFVKLSSLVIMLFMFISLWLKRMTGSQLLYSAGLGIFALILLSSADLITFYVSFEALSLLTYGIIAGNKTIGAAESGLKYFIYGIVSSILLIFGLSLHYLVYKSTNFYEAYMYDGFLYSEQNNLWMGIVSFIFLILSFSYKLSMFPFHFSLPDVYNGVSWETIAIINLIVKLALALVLFRVWSFFISQFVIVEVGSLVLLGFASISMIIGCFGAVVQNSLKRFLAYTSINQAGFVVLGVATNSLAGLQSSLIYLTTYMVMLFIFFVGVTENTLLEDSILSLNNFSLKSKFLVTISLFSMAGIPPFFGFVSKYWMWLALVNTLENSANNLQFYVVLLALVISILISLISAFYYLRLIKVYMFSSQSVTSNSTSMSIATVLAIGLGFLLLIGWFLIAYDILYYSQMWALGNYGSWLFSLWQI